MKVIHVAAECTPIIKVGGLGDVVHSLSEELSHRHEVEILLPLYTEIFSYDENHILLTRSLSYEFLGQQTATAISYSFNQQILTVIRLDTFPDLFGSPIVYSDNDIMKFCAFSAAACAYIQEVQPNIVHMHDWHVGLLAGLLKYTCPQIRLIFTIHNFSYRGYAPTQLLGASTIDPFWLSHYQLFRDDQTSVLLKGALYCSDYITTVSPSYAKEITQDYSDYEMHDAIMAKHHVFSGILNGLNSTLWDPETDPNLVANYGKELLQEPDQLFIQKSSNKTHLYKKLGLSKEYEPLLCIISRIVEQKGIDFMKEAILHAMENSYTLVLIGTCFNAQIQEQFVNLRDSLAGTPNVRIILEYNDSLSRLLYAAADMICIPSLFEPCGLTQLIAMRYGTVPLVRATGGLADTVFQGVNGFTFYQTENFSEFRHMLSSAIHTYRFEPEQWFNLVEQGMNYQSDISLSAQLYENIYQM